MFSAAILAGGRARRFDGVDKSALVIDPRDGRTILARQTEMLVAVGQFRELLLVRSTGGSTGDDSSDSVNGTRSGWSVRTIADRVPGSGPLGGIHAALTAAIEMGDQAVFVLACDMPYVSDALVTYLLGLAHTTDAVIPRTEDGYHPLCAVYSHGCLEPIARRLSEGRLKVIDVLDDVKARVVDPAEIDRFGDRHRLLANVNTPDEYHFRHDHALQTAHNHQP
jgi:molybdopterin-guanine dinucleotide biosynthesis protein A